MATSRGSIAATVGTFEALGDGGIQWGVVEIPLGGGAWGPAEPRTENIYGCPVPNGIRFEMTH